MYTYDLKKYAAYLNVTAYGVFILFKQFGLCALTNDANFALLVDISLIDKTSSVIYKLRGDLRENREKYASRTLALS